MADFKIPGIGKIDLKDAMDKTKEFVGGDDTQAVKGINHLSELLLDSDMEDEFESVGVKLPSSSDRLHPRDTISQIGTLSGKMAEKGIINVNDTDQGDFKQIKAELEAYVKGNDSGAGATAAYNALSTTEKDAFVHMLDLATSYKAKMSYTDPTIKAIKKAAKEGITIDAPAAAVSTAPTAQKAVSTKPAPSEAASATPVASSNVKVDPTFEKAIKTELGKFHDMISAQGQAMQAQMGFDYAGATADGKLSKGDSFIMMSQFADKLKEEGHLSGRAAKPVSNNTKEQAISVMQDYLGNEAGIVKSLDNDAINATINLIRMPEGAKNRMMNKVMQDGDMKEVREFPKKDNISAVFYVPASGDQEEMVIDINKPTKTQTNAYVEVDSHIYTPDDLDIG